MDIYKYRVHRYTAGSGQLEPLEAFQARLPAKLESPHFKLSRPSCSIIAVARVYGLIDK